MPSDDKINLNRRAIMTGAVSGLAFSFMNPSEGAAQTRPNAADNNLSGQANFVASYFALLGYGNFIIVDKNRAEMALVSRTPSGYQVIEKKPVLLGRTRGDEFRNNGDITGAGVFTGLPARGVDGANEIMYHSGTRLIYTIHPATGSNRLNRLNSPIINDNWDTSACLATYYDFSQRAFQHLMADPERFVNALGHTVAGRRVIILPHNEGNTRGILSIPDGFRPGEFMSAGQQRAQTRAPQ